MDLAYELALPYREEPLGLLIVSLAKVFSHDVEDLRGGLEGLRSLLEDESVDPALRIEAGMAYGRAIGVYRERGMYSEYDGVDLGAVFDRVIALGPSGRQAPMAAMYKAELKIYDEDPAVQAEAFDFVEAFIRDYRGDPRDLVALRLFVERFYIALRGDYSASVRHLEMAHETGIRNATTAREVLYRLGRMSHLKLADREKAVRYYQEFRERYPYSMQIALVLRYLEELGVSVERESF